MGIIAILVVVMMISAICASAEVDNSLPAVENSCALCSRFTPVDMGEAENSGCSKLWALDSCKGKVSDLFLPAGARAAMEILPGYSSYLTLYHRLPSGDLQTEYLGYLYKGHSYRLSFCPDTAGTHEFWYRTGWQESNRVRFNAGI